MRTLVRSLALFVLAAALVAAGNVSTAPAMQKEKDKKKVEEIGTIEVYQAKDGWRFKVVNDEGKAIAIGTVGHDKKEDCLKTVEFLKVTMAKGKVVEPKPDKK